MKRKIKKLEADSPDPQSILLIGKFQVLNEAKRHYRILTEEEGAVDGYLKQGLNAENIKAFLGKDVTMTGKAFFMPGGKISYFIIEGIFPTGGELE